MNYWDYIRVEDLLKLQGGVNDDESKLGNDEVLFVVVHQVFELWFKLVVRELDGACALFRQNPVPDMALANATRSFRRASKIFELAVDHFSVMETMTTRDYLAFRDGLIGASGFQSAQMREIEILLGLDDKKRIPMGPSGNYKEALRAADGSASPALKRVLARLETKDSLKSLIEDWLSRTPVSKDGPDAFLKAFLVAHEKELERRLEIVKSELNPSPTELESWRARYQRENENMRKFVLAEDDPERTPEERERRLRIRAALIFLESHRELPRLAWPREAIDALLEMEQKMVIWRQRHARMVERVIGRRVGTGGSDGVAYLDQTALAYRVFDDIWSVRTLLVRKESIPPLENAQDFRFRVEDELP